jgi:WD40 repeat protein
VNFQDAVGVPEEAATRPATIILSFDAWKEARILPSQFEIDVVARPPGPTPEPVSPRLKRKLVHPNRKGTIVVIAYAPDGKRIVAGDYPGGVVQFWDADSSKELVTIDTGYGYHTSTEYFALSPDWKTLFSARRGMVNRTIIERDGKKLARYEFDGDVRAWDVRTGKLRRTFKHSPPRGITWMELSPNGQTFMTSDQLPGIAEVQPPHAVSLWDVETGQSRDLGADLVPVSVYTPDGQALALQAQNEKGVVTAVKLFDVPTGREKLSIPITEKDARRIGWMVMSPDGRQLVGQLRDETNTGQHWLKFWDVATGQEQASVTGEKRAFFMWMDFSPDSQTLAVTTASREGANKLFVFDTAAGTSRYVIDLAQKSTAWPPAFSPDGQWIALATQVLPDTPGRGHEAEDIAQAHIHLIEAATSKVQETIVSPPGLAQSVCFSPDGKTLASSGDGCVLLWDLTNPPLRDREP